MYQYNLIIKHNFSEDAAVRAMVNQQLTRRFGPDVHYNERSVLTHEAVVIVRGFSKRSMQSTLGDWFAEGDRTEAGERAEAEGHGGYPEGTLLHYREILPDEFNADQLGG